MDGIAVLLWVLGGGILFKAYLPEALVVTWARAKMASIQAGYH